MTKMNEDAMDITVYSIPDCLHCSRVKELFERAELDFTNLVVGQDISKEVMTHKFPLAKGFPYVIIDGQAIPGLQATAKYLVDRGFASKMRKTKVSNCKSCNQ
tara:strand:- start:1636 stop:1944 length:309 start_codon:yes stop_codon:yes gene_type:complete